ncbi:thymidine kinase [bacterium]|nr:thymidine kinase [bacterium]
MNVIQAQGVGWIEVVCGCMFSGKTEELIRRIRRAEIAKQKTIIFKPQIDNRYSESEVVSHSQQKIQSINVKNAQEVLEQAKNAEVIGIDEAQFLGTEIVEVCNILANQGKRVIVAGLDKDYLGVPFEPVPQLLAIAEYITKTLAICTVCGNPASFTQRLIDSQKRVLVGAENLYEARCRKCFRP